MRIRWKRVGAAVLAAAGIAFAAFAFPEGSASMMEYHAEADKGDTVWDLCARVASNEDNMSELVYRTMKENHIEKPGELQPGQMVIIRVKQVQP